MDLNKIMELLSKPKGWLKITPDDIIHLNDYCKQLVIENNQLRKDAVSRCKLFSVESGGFHGNDKKWFDKWVIEKGYMRKPMSSELEIYYDGL